MPLSSPALRTISSTSPRAFIVSGSARSTRLCTYFNQGAGNVYPLYVVLIAEGKYMKTLK
jgi:hypothetical protein